MMSFLENGVSSRRSLKFFVFKLSSSSAWNQLILNRCDLFTILNECKFSTIKIYLIAKYIPCCFYCYDVRAIVKHFEQDWAVRLAIGIFVEHQLGQVSGLQSFPRHWIRLEPLDVGYNVNQVENISLLVTIRIGPGLKLFNNQWLFDYVILGRRGLWSRKLPEDSKHNGQKEDAWSLRCRDQHQALLVVYLQKNCSILWRLNT